MDGYETLIKTGYLFLNEKDCVQLLSPLLKVSSATDTFNFIVNQEKFKSLDNLNKALLASQILKAFKSAVSRWNLIAPDEAIYSDAECQKFREDLNNWFVSYTKPLLGAV